jgi:hypothetical protein
MTIIRLTIAAAIIVLSFVVGWSLAEFDNLRAHLALKEVEIANASRDQPHPFPPPPAPAAALGLECTGKLTSTAVAQEPSPNDTETLSHFPIAVDFDKRSVFGFWFSAEKLVSGLPITRNSADQITFQATRKWGEDQSLEQSIYGSINYIRGTVYADESLLSGRRRLTHRQWNFSLCKAKWFPAPPKPHHVNPCEAIFRQSDLAKRLGEEHDPAFIAPPVLCDG